MEADYNFYLVTLSIIIAIISSYSALSITSKISNATGKNRIFWLTSGAIVMGAGVWSMHFIGMLAYHMHVTVEYNVFITLLSMFASIASSFIAFYITMPKIINRKKILLGGLCMGSGIVIMHYLGMEAMIMEADISYQASKVLLSIIIAFVASYAALFLFTRFRNHSNMSWTKWLSAIIMGFAICGMHYTGMSATTIPNMNSESMQGSTSINLFLLYSVIVTIFLIIVVSWITMFFDRYVLEKMAYQDSITDLSNRNEMNRFLNKQPTGEKLGVLYLDLDHFKAINDTLGHDTGDLLLIKMGELLKKLQNDQINTYRIGGDEFLIITKDSELEDLEQLANSLLEEIKQPFHINGNELYVTGSIGIVIDTVDEADHTKLLRAADTAMYVAKKQGKNQYSVYTTEMGLKEVRKMELEKDLQRALKENQFYMEYQPKWNVKTNTLYGFEALIRWEHPRLGIIAPSEFIPIAEETGLIVPLTRWTIEEACQQCKHWHSQNIMQTVAVNISPSLFHTGTLYGQVSFILEKINLDPKYLELEITESMMLHDLNDIIKQLEAIQALGVKVSMDDFGTGYSSLGLLDVLPINAVKLDRIFTMDIDNPSKRAIIQAIIVLAESLELDVIAEGVELEKDIDHLTKLGCYVMQGYYYSKPLKIENIQEWTIGHET
ncbi:bifunctional diguanylate cyclase/phosphodiesterase [Gracilibacillus massiliensis]|uniref:bifunctional diguanylate cyclase/phosphodiesterase n=1 Tax=Gracilibacillus massiliensis TaxID=1564956 RepID=UPI00071D8D4F|nr:bifunctional diguanylate cyclase/phosphodiesterase [Gracilibacillus massiliensis]